MIYAVLFVTYYLFHDAENKASFKESKESYL